MLDMRGIIGTLKHIFNLKKNNRKDLNSRLYIVQYLIIQIAFKD